jgi:hypothetical protein
MSWTEEDDESGVSDIRIIALAAEAAIRLDTIDLTIYSSANYRIVLHDGTYTVWGWIGEADAEETLGSELVDNGGFANWTGDDPDDWSLTATEDANNYVTETGGTAQIVSDKVKAIGIFQNLANGSATVAHRLYKITQTIVINTLGWRFGIRDVTNGVYLTGHSLTNRVDDGTIDTYFTAMSVYTRPYYYRHGDAASDWQPDNVTCKQVTALGLDAVHIYNGMDYATRGWVGDTENFNWNAVTTLEIESYVDKKIGKIREGININLY